MGPLIGHLSAKILFHDEESHFYCFSCLALLLGAVFCVLPRVTYVPRLLLLYIVTQKLSWNIRY